VAELSYGPRQQRGQGDFQEDDARHHVALPAVVAEERVGKHCDQVQNNPFYATALAAMVTTLAELAIHDAFALSILDAGIAVYLNPPCQ
jgi:hypothetical protein